MQRQILVTTLYGRYLRRTGPGILNTAWQVVKNVHAGKLDNDGLGGGNGRAMYGKLERTATVALWIPSAEKLYLAVRDKYPLKNMTRRPRVVLNCLVACCRSDDGMFEMLK